jgi:hypothetical protein
MHIPSFKRENKTEHVSTSAVSGNYFQESVIESLLGFKPCSCPHETEIPVCTAKQNLTVMLALITMILPGGLLHLIRQSAIILYCELYVQK